MATITASYPAKFVVPGIKVRIPGATLLTSWKGSGRPVTDTETFTIAARAERLGADLYRIPVEGYGDGAFLSVRDHEWAHQDEPA